MEQRTLLICERTITRTDSKESGGQLEVGTLPYALDSKINVTLDKNNNH